MFPQSPAMSSLQPPRRGTKDFEVAAILSPSGPGELPVAAGGAPPALTAPVAPQGRPQLLTSLRLQKLHVQHCVAGRARRPTESGSPLAWGLGTRGTGSRPLQAAGPSLIDADPVDEEVLRALVLELGLDRADEFDCPADLPASC